MFSSAENKRCGICSQNVAEGQGEALFTAECSHCFHFSCINTYVSRLCPVCNAKWNQLPFIAPVHNPPFRRPFNYYPMPQFVNEPVEPIQFFDDEPLPDNSSDPMSVDVVVDSEKVSIKAIPERPAVAAAESASLFAVFVGLKAPSLSLSLSQPQRAPLDIVTVLDVSGSMSGRKLDLVKRAVHFVIDNLGVCDRLSIVSFSDHATRMLPLKRMTETGREDAKRAVALLHAGGGTNILQGLTKGARVLDERRFKNPVATIIFLSDGNDTYNLRGSLLGRNAPEYLNFLPPSIFPSNQASQVVETSLIPVHSFGFGSDHDPITMHAISEASGGTFSFIQTYEMVQDAFASCIGGLMSVVTHELRLKVRSASHGVEIKSIPSGRYRSEISNQGSQGLINVGDLYADEEKKFLINLSIPISQGEEGKTSLLDITCSYKDAVSKQVVEIEGDLVEIKRPEAPTPQDMAVNLEVDRQRNRLRAAESIQQAQQMAEAGNLTGAKELLAKNRNDLMASAAGQAGDGLVRWLEGEMKETERRMGSAQMYEQSGRAYAMAGISSHASQRATSRGNMVAGAAAPVFGMGDMDVELGAAAPSAAACFGGYATPQMANMVNRSREKREEGGEGNTPKKE